MNIVELIRKLNNTKPNVLPSLTALTILAAVCTLHLQISVLIITIALVLTMLSLIG